MIFKTTNGAKMEIDAITSTSLNFPPNLRAEAVNQKLISVLLLPLFSELMETLTPFMPITVLCQSLFCNVCGSS